MIADVVTPECLTLTDQLSKLVNMEPSTVGAFDAKTRLSELLEEVARGRSFVITRRGRPIAELRPVAPAEAARLTFGCDKGQVTMTPAFTAPLPDFAAYES